ncbi:MAG TPA: hypothetical protein VHZ50_07310, partial [Puia sp.]|nr:hypothetical protein [Puia sp.]
TKKTFLLDSNEGTVEKNKAGLTLNSILYSAPGKLPFEDKSVNLIHTSHMIEYLTPEEMYKMMMEMDRVMMDDCYIIISAPLIWGNFYDDLGHIRPYNPFIFHKYFINLNHNNRLDKVSSSYETKELIYRYSQLPVDEGWSSSVPVIDYCMIMMRRFLGKIGFRKLQKNGYSLVLQKKSGS